MATYISLINFTQKGIENIKESPDRLDQAKEAYRAAGAEIKEFYLTMGHYDAVSVFEAPSDEVVARLALAIGAGGSIRTETLRAFPEGEYRKVIGGLQ